MNAKITWAVLLIVLVMPSASTHYISHSSGKGLASTINGVQVPTVSSTATVGPNVDIAGEAFPDRQKAETTVAVDPRNPSIIVAGAQDYNLQCCPSSSHRWHGYYRSTDDGQTWTSSLLPGFPGDTSPQGLGSPLHNFNLATDPVLAFDRAGNVYYAGIAINTGTAGFSAFVAKYVNDGANYAGVTLIPLSNDKPWIAVDTSGGPKDGNVYLVYQGAGGSLLVRSTDQGGTFSTPILVPGGAFVTGVTVDPAGTVYVVSYDFNLGRILVSKSTDGGLTLSQFIVVASKLTPIPQENPRGNMFRVVTLPQIVADNRGVYVVTDDNSTGTMDVLFSRSVDGGATWSAPLIINDETKGQHFDPTIAVSGGTISIAWYDSRLALNSNGTMTALDVFYTTSADAGAAFSSNIRITSVSFNPNNVRFADFARGGAFIGDYDQIAATPTEAHVIWADTRNACDVIDPQLGCIDQDAFTSTISIIQGTPDFSISAIPASSTITAGTTGNSTIVLATVGNFSGTILLSTSVFPGTGLKVSLSSTSVALFPGLTLATSRLTVTGTGGIYNVTVTGTNGTLNGTHSTQVSITVEDVSINASPTSLVIGRESSNTTTFKIASLNGFAGTISLSLSISPNLKNGPVPKMKTTAITLTPGGAYGAIITVSAKSSTPLGSYTLTVTASTPTISHTFSIKITVVAGRTM